MQDRVKALTRSALSAAAGFAVLYIASVLPWGRLALICASALGVFFVRMSCSCSWALGCYGATALLSLLLLPSKAAAILYTAFFGYYPVVKMSAERLGKKALRWIAKLAVFNAALLVLYALAGAVLPKTAWDRQMPLWIMWFAANAAFVMYDFVIGQMILYYIRNIAGRLK